APHCCTIILGLARLDLLALLVLLKRWPGNPPVSASCTWTTRLTP
ncbi:unnamed protein product, partial [Ectocarpus sp. 12 AP-2014]